MPRVGKRPEDRRRQANVPSGQRSKRVHIKLSELEHARVRVLANSKGVSIPRLYVQAAFSENTEMRERIHAALRSFRSVTAPLMGVAKPVNDLAHSANIHHAPPAGLRDVLAQVEPALQQLDDAIAQYRDVLIDITAAREAKSW